MLHGLSLMPMVHEKALVQIIIIDDAMLGCGHMMWRAECATSNLSTSQNVSLWLKPASLCIKRVLHVCFEASMSAGTAMQQSLCIRSTFTLSSLHMPQGYLHSDAWVMSEIGHGALTCAHGAFAYWQTAHSHISSLLMQWLCEKCIHVACLDVMLGLALEA